MFHHNTFVISQDDLKRHCCDICNLQLKHLEDDSFCASKTPNRKSSTVFQFLLTLDADSWTVYLSHPTLSFLLCSFPSSPPQVLQSALDRIRHGRTGSRLANIHRQHQYVSMRPCASSWFYMVIMTMNSISGPSVCTLLCICSGW